MVAVNRLTATATGAHFDGWPGMIGGPFAVMLPVTSPSPTLAMRLPAAETEPSIIRSTLRALLQPRRLIPIVLVSASLVAAQANYSYDPLAIPLGIAMCVAFVIVAPVSWRVLFPDRIDFGHGGIRLLLYGAIGAGVVWSISIVAPRALGMGPTLLTAPSGAVVSLALFLVGGLGLGRDIWLESSLARAEARASAMAREADRAQLLALRSHLDPHFLFNTLNAIAALMREDVEAADVMIVGLSDLLRAALATATEPEVPLRRELELVQMYLDIQLARLGERLTVRISAAPETLDLAVPTLLLQPLVENAIRHGASTRPGRASIAVRTFREDAMLIIEVTDDGPGPPEAMSPGHGLDNTRLRLSASFGPQATLALTRQPAGGAVVRVAIPIRA